MLLRLPRRAAIRLTTIILIATGLVIGTTTLPAAIEIGGTATEEITMPAAAVDGAAAIIVAIRARPRGLGAERVANLVFSALANNKQWPDRAASLPAIPSPRQVKLSSGDGIGQRALESERPSGGTRERTERVFANDEQQRLLDSQHVQAPADGR